MPNRARGFVISLNTKMQLAALGIAKADLNLLFWDGSAWVHVLPCGGGVNTANNTLTAKLDHFTEFALAGSIASDVKSKVYLPLARR
jgi:hypothetical protein